MGALLAKSKAFWLFNALSCATGGVCYGLSTVPWSEIFSGSKFSSWARRKRAVYPRFVLGSNDDGRELYVEADGLIRRKGGRDPIPFDEVIMKWGYRPLLYPDALIGPCNGEEGYYLARHIWGGQYQLDNGKKFSISQDICSGTEEKAKLIKLNFTKKGNGGGKVSKLKLLVGSCEFKWNNEGGFNSSEWNLSMDCKEYKDKDTSSGGASNGNQGEQQNQVKREEVTLLLTQNNYKLEYEQVKRSRTTNTQSQK